ncbi:MAG: alpha/beta fold hydrolase [Candidatus Woesearchaeota archaeon]
MFGKLKEKLKKTLSIFSKKTEEEAEEKQIEQPVEEVEETTAAKEEPQEITEEKEKIKEEKPEPKPIPQEKKVPVIVVKEKKEIEKPVEIREEKEEIISKKVEPSVVKDAKKEVLIFHGWEDDSNSGFIPHLKDFLTKQGYSVKAFDQPNTEEPNFEEWFAFAEEKISKVNKDNLSIVGHSMGGLLSLKIAEKYKIKKLILVAPVGSRPSEEYFKLMGKELSPGELQIFRNYQDKSLDIKKIKANIEEIAFVFGLKDIWINQEIRNFYINSFKDVAEIHVFDKYAHMSKDEETKELPILRELFSRKLKLGLVEHKEPFPEKIFTPADLIKETREKFTPEEEPEQEELPKAEELIEKTKQEFSEEKKPVPINLKKPSAEDLVKEAETEEIVEEEIHIEKSSPYPRNLSRPQSLKDHFLERSNNH